MPELIAAFAELIAGLIAGLVELCIQLVVLVLESLGFAVGHLADKPKVGERRFSARWLLVAFAPLVIVTAVIAGIAACVDWTGNNRRERVRETRRLIEDNVELLAGNVNEEGHLIRHKRKLLDVDDAWGNKLPVIYDETLTHESVTVRSEGADEKANTVDDLSASRRVVRPRKDIVKGAFDKAKDAIRDRLQKRD